MSESEDDIWIVTEPTVDGVGWMVTIQINDDRAITLDRERATEYAYAVLGAVAYAEYDAAVLRQIESKIDQESAVQLIADLRKDRAPLNMEAMHPLSLTPGVNKRHEPFLALSLDGEQIGQWTSADARGHALGLLETIIVADLDSAYLRVLKGLVRVEDHVARAAVADLTNWRTNTEAKD